jgi:uncharacterized protein with PIN domain
MSEQIEGVPGMDDPVAMVCPLCGETFTMTSREFFAEVVPQHFRDHPKV